MALAGGDPAKAREAAERELLARYAGGGDQAAFAELVRRHQDQVFSTCRRVLGEAHLAEDAAQAAFLVLARKAGRLGGAAPLGAWLHRVARQAAQDCAKSRARRERREREAAAMRAADAAERAAAEAAWSEARPLFDAALDALPRGQREALVQRYLYGRSEAEAASDLGLKRTTLAMRAAAGLRRLRERLARCGVALPAALLVSFLEERAVEAAPAGLVPALLAAGEGPAAISAKVVQLAEGVMNAMWWAKAKLAAGCAAAALLAAGLIVPLALRAADGGRGARENAGAAAGKAKGQRAGNRQQHGRPQATPAASAPATAPAATAPAALAEDAAAAVAGNNEFALALFGQLRAQEGNLFFSPYSLATALAMTYGGARGDTAAQMAQALHFALPAERLHAAQAALLRSLNDPARAQNYQLAVANSLWGQRGADFLPAFLALNRDLYAAPLHEVDYAGATEAARAAINAWVEEQTREKIRNLIPENVLAARTKLVLVNAIYFKGNWARRFPEAATEEQPFHAAGGGEAPVPLMSQTAEFRYAEDEQLQALALPYVGEELELVVLLPRARAGLPALEESLTAARLAALLGRLQAEEVQVFLPRFRLEPAGSNLAPQFQALGMPQAFMARVADFSGMNGHVGDDESLYIAAIIHKAFVEVNEEGTEAAAATGVIMAPPPSFEEPPPPPVFRADHPFLFLICERASGAILFLGRLADPGAGGP